MEHTNIIYTNTRDCHSITCDQYAAQYGFPGEDTAQRWDSSSWILYFSVLYLTEMTHLLTSNIWLALFTRSTEVKEAPPPLQKEATQFSSKWNKCRWRIERERFCIYCGFSLTVCFHSKVYLSRLQQSGKREKAHKVSHASGETGLCATIKVLKIFVIRA